MSDLKRRTIKGLFWSITDSFGIYFLKFGFSVAIARILMPEDYGLIGMMLIFIGISSMFVEGGFSVALIQKKEATQSDFSTIFFLNLAIAILFYSLIVSFSNKIANFYSEPRLPEIIPVISLSILIAPFSIIQTTILSKKLNFRLQAIINLTGTLLSGILGLIMAIEGYGVWALIFQTLSGMFIRTVLLWILNKWSPNFVFSLKSLKSLFNYSYKIFLAGILDRVFINIYYPIIGRHFTTTDLGFYTQAKRFHDLFILQFAIAYGKVTFSSLSTIQDQKESLINSYKKIFQSITFIIFPLMVLLIVTARPFVSFFLTEKWMFAVPFMKAFYLNGFLFPLYMLNINIFAAMGKSGIPLIFEIIKKSLMLISIFLTLKYGIIYLIFGQVLSAVLTFISSLYYLNSRININIHQRIVEIFYILLISLIVFLVTNYSIPLLISHDFLLLLVQFNTGVVLYILLCKTLKPRPYIAFRKAFIGYIPVKIRFLI